MKSRTDALLVTEPGGHLLEMWAMRDVVPRDRRAWCTIGSPDVRSLLRDEDVTICHGPTCRSVRNLARNLPVAWRVIRSRRPRVILCTGSGIVVPFAWVGRLLGARVLYVECGGRVGAPSLSCRIVNPATHRTYVQWPELAAKVRRSRFHGRLPWERAATAAGPRPAGGLRTVVTVGTSRIFPFDRLVEAAGPAVQEGSVKVQCGTSQRRPAGATVVDFMQFDELSEAMAAADAVVTHAGVGSVLLAIMHGHHPIVMPRRPDLGEGVDAHQVEFARRLEHEGLAIVVDGPADVAAALRTIRLGTPAAPRRDGRNELLRRITDDVRRALAGEPCATS